MTAPRLLVLAAAAGALAAGACAGPAGAAGHTRTTRAETLVLQIRTIPAVPGARYRFAGRILSADHTGVLRVRLQHLVDLTSRIEPLEDHLGPNVVARFKQWHGHLNARPSRTADAVLVKTLTATFDLYYRVRIGFVVSSGKPPPGKISNVFLRASTGTVQTFKPSTTAPTLWLWGKRVVPYHDSLQVKNVYWVFDRVEIDGSNVVNQSQQKIIPSRSIHGIVPIRLLYFAAHIRSRDALVPVNIGSSVDLRLPNGAIRRYTLDHGRLVLSALPRGRYQVKPVGFGIAFWTPVALSRDQAIDVRLISYFDLAFVGLVIGGIAFVLAAARRPSVRRRARSVLTLSKLPAPR